jgi:hypothetical protein
MEETGMTFEACIEKTFAYACREDCIQHGYPLHKLTGPPLSSYGDPVVYPIIHFYNIQLHITTNPRFVVPYM